jgi:hypothetical protein
MSSTPQGAEPGLTDVLGGLRMLVAQLRLYPKNSPQVAKVGTSACQAIVSFLEKRPALTLASSPEGLLVNATRFPVDDPMTVSLETSTLSLLRDAGVKSVTFKAGAVGDEVLTFLHAMAHKFWELRDGKKINLRLREERVINVAVDEVEYVEIGKDDLLLKEALPKLEAAGFDVQDLLKTIDERLEVAIDQGKGPEARLGILRKMLEQDPSLLGQLIKEGGVPTARVSDAPGLMTFDTALDAVRKIWKSMATASTEAREALRNAAQAIVGAFRGNAAVSAALEQAITAESPELVPDWLKDAAATPPENTAAARAVTILFLRPEARAEALLREGKTLIPELVAAGRMDLVEQVLGVAGAPIEDPSSKKRFRAAQTIMGWSQVLESEALAQGCEALRRSLNLVLDKEREAPIYAKLVELAGMLLESRLKKHGAGGAAELVETLKRHSAGTDPEFPERSSLARAALPKDQITITLPALPGGKSTADRVAAAVHAASIQFLIAQMKDMESTAERLELATTVSRMGSDAGILMVDELKKTKIPSEIIRLLEVLPWVTTPALAEETLTSLLTHPVVMVRRRAALMLVERKYDRTEEILLDAFETREPSGRLGIAEALGRLGTERALVKLRHAVESRDLPDDVRGACCAALGLVGDPKSLALLTSLATPPARGLTRIFRSVTPALRAAAARALAAFSAQAEVRDLLQRLQSDAEELVRGAAKEALRPSARFKVPVVAAPVPVSAAEPATPSAPAEPAPATAGFSGLISEITLDQICQVIGSAHMTGLLLANFEGPTAKVYFDKGLIVSADFEGKKDQEAFNAFFGFKEGAFVFKPGERTLEPRIKASVDQVLIGAFGVSNQSQGTSPHAGAA